MFFTHGKQEAPVNSGQAALRKLAYSEAGQTLAPINEWQANEAYL